MADLKSMIAEAIANGLAGAGASDSRKRRRNERTERTDERRGREATYDVNGTTVTRKSRRGVVGGGTTHQSARARPARRSPGARIRTLT